MARIRVFAPAKINLALHITGQRADGYHELDTLVAFASVGDWVTLDTGLSRGFAIDGPEAAGLTPDAGNLVVRAAMDFWGEGMGPLHLTLTKVLPVSSGIGGGSADAAACVRGMLELMEEMGKPMPAREGLMGRLLQLGADVPMCAASRPARVRGIGDQIERLAELAALPVLLVNPRIAVATPVIFKALANKNNSGMEALPDDLGHAGGLIGYIARQRNDLQAPALAAAPEIGHVLVELAASAGCALARMSGSGATCFGIFESGEARDAAALQIAGARPDWWVQAALLDGQDRAAAQNIS